MDRSRERTGVVDLERARLTMAIKRGYRNWVSQLGEQFGLETRLSNISLRNLALLAQGGQKSTFYLYDLIMNLTNLGSGFEFDELDSSAKMGVVDRYLFLLDRIRFEYMKRLGWLENYPGEEVTLVELVLEFDRLAPNLQSKTPELSQRHPAFESFTKMNAFEREELVRKMIPKALKKIQDHSTTL